MNKEAILTVAESLLEDLQKMTETLQECIRSIKVDIDYHNDIINQN